MKIPAVRRSGQTGKLGLPAGIHDQVHHPILGLQATAYPEHGAGQDDLAVLLENA